MKLLALKVNNRLNILVEEFEDALGVFESDFFFSE